MDTGTRLLTAFVLAGAISAPPTSVAAPSHLPSTSAAPRPPVDVTLRSPLDTRTARPRPTTTTIELTSAKEAAVVTADAAPPSPAPLSSRTTVNPRDLLRDHWGDNPELKSSSPSRITGVAVAGLVMLIAACGLLWCWKRLGGGWGGATVSSPALSLRASLPLRPGVSLHLLRTVDSDVLVAVDQRGLQSVMLLRNQFDLSADDEEEATEAGSPESASPRPRSLVPSSPFSQSFNTINPAD